MERKVEKQSQKKSQKLIDAIREEQAKENKRFPIIRNTLSPYKEMFSWLNSFTINFLKRDASSSLASSLPMESFLALIDNLAPERIDRRVRDKAGPFFNQGNEIGIILVHGFSSTAQEMQELGEFIHEQTGFTSLSILLAGHGTSPADLAQTDMIDWYKSVKEAYDFLKETCKKIALVGHSMGGTLSLVLAANEEVDAVVSLCTPIKVEYFMQDYIHLVNDLLQYFPRRKEEIELMDKNHLINYRISSLKAVEHMLDLMEIAREEIKKVKSPIFTITAGKDERVPLHNAQKIHELVQSEIKEDYFFENAIHTILHDEKKHAVFDKILAFLKSILE
ncbi:MAG: alpha/beta fold hydrolase [Asgard group archaeon]|nr:alpha/beta fold hydrolase [Asgard group archaeon]